MLTSELIVAVFNAKWVAKQVGDSSSSTIIALSCYHRQRSNQGCRTLNDKRTQCMIFDFRAWKKIGIIGGNV